jgi:P-type E1-E2 ATPase
MRATLYVEQPMEPLALEHLVLDLNGTLTNRGKLIAGVEDRLRMVRERFSVHLATADTFGTAAEIATHLGLDLHPVGDGTDKRRLVVELGPDATAAIGNGVNDVPMLRAVRLGIVVIGPEGASSAALAAADVVTSTVLEALDLVRDPRALEATLRT